MIYNQQHITSPVDNRENSPNSLHCSQEIIDDSKKAIEYEAFPQNADNEQNYDNPVYSMIEKMNVSRRNSIKKKASYSFNDNSTDDDDYDFFCDDDVEYNGRSRKNLRKKKNHKKILNSSFSNSMTRVNGKDRNGSHIGWTFEEDNKLRDAIEIFGNLNWKRISDYIGTGKTRSQCSQRWNRCLNPHISKEKWSNEELDLLKQLVNQYGDGCWSKIASKMGNRCDVQCRYMWRKITGQKNTKSQAISHENELKANNNVNVRINEDNFFQENDLDMFLISDHQNSIECKCSPQQQSLNIENENEKKINLTNNSIFPVSGNLLANLYENGFPIFKFNSQDKINDEKEYHKEMIIDLFPPKNFEEDNSELYLNSIDVFI